MKATLLSFILCIVVNDISAAHLSGHGLSLFQPLRLPSSPERFPSTLDNYRVRRQSIGGPFQSSRLSLSRFPSFSTGRRFPQITSLSQRNPLLARRISGRRSSPFISAPITSEFSTRSSPGRVVQLGRSSSLLRGGQSSPLSSSSVSTALRRSRGGIRSFGTQIGVPRRSTLGLSSLDSRLRQQLAAGYTGSGTRDDPIRLISSRPTSRRTISSVRRSSQLSRASTSGRRAPVSRAAQTAGNRNDNNDEEVIALFGFDTPTLSGLGIEDSIPKLSETIDAPVGVKRTPIQKASGKSTPIVQRAFPRIDQISENAKISGLELHGAGFAVGSKKEIIKATESQTVATKPQVTPLKIAKDNVKVPAKIIKDTTKVISDVKQTQLESKLLTQVAHQTKPKAIADIPTEVLSGVQSDAVPVQAEAVIPIVKEEVVQVLAESASTLQSAATSSVDKKAVIDTKITDADQVNININTDANFNNNNKEQAPVDSIKPIVSESITAVDASNNVNIEKSVEPSGVFVESQIVTDVQKGVILEPTVHQAEELASSVVVDSAVHVLPIIPVVDEHKVGGISVIPESVVPNSGADIQTAVDVGAHSEVIPLDIVVDTPSASTAIDKIV